MHEKISTKELVEELKEREGVKTEYAEPHQDKKLSVNGPAVILIISEFCKCFCNFSTSSVILEFFLRGKKER